MGYNSRCLIQDCYDNCCNTQGNCPSRSTQCKYYYVVESNAGLIAGLSVGGILALAIVIAIVCYCYRKKQVQTVLEQLRRKQQLNATHQEISHPYQQHYYQTNFNPQTHPSFQSSPFAHEPFPHPTFAQISFKYSKIDEHQPFQNRPVSSSPPFTRVLNPQTVQGAIIIKNM